MTEEVQNAVFEDGGNIVVDMGEIKEATFEAIPKGMYDFEVDSVEFGMSKSSGAPMLTLQLRIPEGEYANRRFWTYWVFSPKALPFTKAAINRIAPELLQGPFKPQEVADSGVLLGKRGRMRLTIENYEGVDRNRVSQLLPPPADGEQQSSGADNGKGKFF